MASSHLTKGMGKAALTLLAMFWIATSARYAWDDSIARVPECRPVSHVALYRSETLAKLANQCLGDIRLSEAKTLSLAALRRQPHNQLALAILGSVADLAGSQAQADAWMRAAASLGKRDYIVEAYWLTGASADAKLGDKAQRVDALFRAGWGNDVIAQEARSMEATTPGRTALTSLALAHSPWFSTFLKDVHDLSDSELANRRAFLIFLTEKQSRSAADPVLNMDTAAAAVSELYHRKFIDLAETLRNLIPPNKGHFHIRDPHFALADKDYGPFDWKLTHDPGLDVAIARSSATSTSLSLRAETPGRYEVARQTIRLSPGAYQIEVTSGTDAAKNQSDGRLVISLKPVIGDPKSTTLRMPLPQSGRPSVARFDIGGSYPFYVLSLALDTLDVAEPVEVDLVTVAIRPLGTRQ